MEMHELAQRIRRGDRDALKALISEYGVGIYQKAYRKTQDKVLAREATRQTFAQLVTALQEQTDMDGWELWLNALAKRNIETYANIGSDMAYLESQLNEQLLSPAAQAAAQPADAARQFALQQQLEAQQAARKQYEAQLLAQRQLEAQQAAQRQYEAQLMAQRQLEAQEAAQRQYEAQLQQAAQQQAAQQQAAQQEAQKPAAQPAAQAGPAERALPPEGAKRRVKSRARRHSEDGDRPSNPAWPVIVPLMILCVLLVWLVLGVTMSLGWLPMYDLGYAWFNANILDLF